MMMMKKRTVPQAVFDSKDALRVAAEATAEARRELEKTPASMLDIGNPNHPIYDVIFGYDKDVFMSLQYKRKD